MQILVYDETSSFTKQKAERNRLTLSYPTALETEYRKRLSYIYLCKITPSIFMLNNLFKGVNFFNSFRKVDW